MVKNFLILKFICSNIHIRINMIDFVHFRDDLGFICSTAQMANSLNFMLEIKK